MNDFGSEAIGLLEVTDVSGQKTATLQDIPAESTVGDLIRSLVPRMELPERDSNGTPLTYHALLEREGRHLFTSERVGGALAPGDRLVLQPNIDAGRS